MKVKSPIRKSYLTKGKIYEVIENDESSFYIIDDDGDMLLCLFNGCSHLYGQDWIIIPEGMPNREFLADFIKLNNIKKTLVSKYLGMAENWLTTMVNEKRATRKDISDATLQDIMRKLHIDWTSQEFINVKATKSNTSYKTKPCNYSRVVDKERLQRSMWNGELLKA